MRILFDTNVIIDALTMRPPFHKSCSKLIIYASQDKIEAYVSAKQVADIYYILRKYIADENDKRNIIKTIVETFNVLPLLPSDIKYCLNSDFSDFEDALIDECAKVNMLDTIVTSNTKDFEKSKLTIVTPLELESLIEQSE